MHTTWSDLLRPGDASDFFKRQAMPAFDPGTADFIPGNALWLAELSRIIYRRDVQEQRVPPHPQRSRFLDEVGLRTLGFYACARVGAQAMLVQSDVLPTYAALVFRGTEQDPRDLITDLDVGLATLSRRSVGVHRGFQRALDSIWPNIEARLRTLTCPVFYTGHSLGAAMAILAAVRRAPRAVYAFGAPRVGNALFAAQTTDLTIHRVVHGADLVTALPPTLLGYRHVGSRHLLPAQTIPQAPLSLRWRQPPRRLADHAPIHYVDALDKSP
ncbi:MAG TPA: lipase family protein [Aquabacterium sp.]|uniref:lipase family protein n=1 Tax=Aquabacterium sp. TaxID=1872578 RepID=UPI002E3404BB|nr:lipase family protein [Aquabacterium sp.]HEX5374368.1 lipase family protein [Aquabacterium sp.]